MKLATVPKELQKWTTRLKKSASHFSRQEALVLFDYLRRCDEEAQYSFGDPAEQRVLWNLEAALEKSLLEVFDPEYDDLLRKARAALRDEDLLN